LAQRVRLQRAQRISRHATPRQRAACRARSPPPSARRCAVRARATRRRRRRGALRRPLRAAATRSTLSPPSRLTRAASGL
jgi:hypothetical protein